MLRLSFLAALALCAVPALPAAAAPVHIVVPGGSPGYIHHHPHYSGQYSFWGNNYFFMNQRSFDSGRAITDALLGVPWANHSSVPYYNEDTAFTLLSTGDSVASHMIKCQNAYSSYSIVDDSYLDGRGIPRPCRF